MALYITSSVALNAQRNLSKATNSLTNSYKKLSSGLRINSAKDDAAGLQLANRLTSQINGLTQGNRNANDGISLCQIADGAMEGMIDMLQRVRTLAIQSANGTNSSSERAALQEETDQLLQEIERTAQTTSYGNGVNLLNGSNNNGSFSLQVGAYSNQTISLNIGDVSYSNLIDKANQEGVSCSYTSSSISGSKNSISIMTADDAQKAISMYDNMIKNIDRARSTCGAVSNRLSYTISNQENMIENLSDSRSRIQDVDYASEVAEMARSNILQQISMTMLSRINESNSLILSLLG